MEIVTFIFGFACAWFLRGVDPFSESEGVKNVEPMTETDAQVIVQVRDRKTGKFVKVKN